jgi:sigma-E factor negative regulatory protein RseA
MNTESNVPRPGPAGPANAAVAGGDDPHQWLSALADGEAQALQPGCALWRDDAAARARWHAYHLIGDVLRSDELATPPARDAAFLERLRERLAEEPVPLAPSTAPVPAASSSRSRHLGWRAPAAVAAGFVAVVGVLVLTRGGPSSLQPDGATPTLAAAPAGLASSGRAPLPPPQWVLSGDQIRDANLDAYLRAHQAVRGGAPAALPGGGLRNVEMIVVPVVSASSPVAPARPAAAASGHRP